jgi:hypothetical protein
MRSIRGNNVQDLDGPKARLVGLTPGATEWALRGLLDAAAATVVEGEKAPPRAKKGVPVRVWGAGGV